MAENTKQHSITIDLNQLQLWSVDNFKKYVRDLNIAKLFSEIPEAHTRGKMSTSRVRTGDLSLSQLYDECDGQSIPV